MNEAPPSSSRLALVPKAEGLASPAIPEPPQTETKLLGSRARSPLPRARMRVEWKGTHGRQSRVIEGRTLLGSSAGVGIVLDDCAVSRVHAELEPRDDGLWIRDLNSKNGTKVDGLRVECARIRNGGNVRVGTTELVALSEAEPKPVELWPHDSFGPLVGGSAPMRELYASLAKVAPTDAPVLILGETGTGKELAARAVHEASSRAGGPFIVVDCAALLDTLLDSELFGHEKGAFTGASSARPGAFEAAEGGTVFLDEIGELPLAMQPKLLRVLESGMIRRIGETKHRPIHVRFVSATHRDLPRMVANGHFREDLYFRLSVLPLTLPPLRNRREDIAGLVEHFLGPDSHLLSEESLEELAERPWRGNVRELRTFVTRVRAMGQDGAVVMSSSSSYPIATRPLEPTSLGPDPSRIPCEGPFRDFRDRWVEQGEREYLRSLLAKHGGNVTAASREAKVDRTYLHRLIRKYSL
jgi:two-component system response regulator GlrR